MMRKIIIFALGGILLTLFGAILFSALQPKPYSYNPSYIFSDKEPYGSFVLGKQLPNLFPQQEVRKLRYADLEPYFTEVSSSYEREGEHDDDENDNLFLFDMDEEEIQHFNFIGINTIFFMGSLDERALWMHLYQGNEALILANNLSKEIKEYLGLVIKTTASDTENTDLNERNYQIQYKEDSLVNFKSQSSLSFIEEYPENAEIIAKNAVGGILGVKIPIGKGYITYFTVPILFSNYYLLKENRSFQEKILQELPLKNTYYARYTSVNQDRNHSYSPSLLSYIHSQKALSWAFYTLLFSILIFMIFQLKRNQRIIPIISPPVNASLKFIETLGNLYLMHNNHKEMALKKMHYFLIQIRQEYNLDYSVINDDFYKKLSLKSKIDEAIVKKVFIKYHYIKARHTVTKEDFLSLCALLQHFKK